VRLFLFIVFSVCGSLYLEFYCHGLAIRLENSREGVQEKKSEDIECNMLLGNHMM
jgi:hypothetical protein